MNLKNFSKLKDGSPQEVFREIAIKAVVRRYSVKEVFLKISQNPKENTVGRVLFLNEVTRFWAAILLKKKTPTQVVFFVNYVKFFRTPFLQNASWRLLL